jgi:hypothetical protein
MKAIIFTIKEESDAFSLLTDSLEEVSILVAAAIGSELIYDDHSMATSPLMVHMKRRGILKHRTIDLSSGEVRLFMDVGERNIEQTPVGGLLPQAVVAQPGGSLVVCMAAEDIKRGDLIGLREPK